MKPKQGRGQPRVVKIIPYDPLRPDDCLREMDLLKAVRQEHIVRLYEGYVWNDFVFLVFEKFYGENVARSLSLKNKYNEYHVTSIIKQVGATKKRSQLLRSLFAVLTNILSKL